MAHLQPARPGPLLGSSVSPDIPGRQEKDADCPDFADGNDTAAGTQGRGWAAPGSHEGLWLALLVLGSAKHLPAASFKRRLCHAFLPSVLGG